MSTIKLIINDLHLADGHQVLDSFGDTQQAAFEGFLRTAYADSPWVAASDVELILNGDCFDFLVVQPYDLDGVIDVSTAMTKLEKIIAAHIPFFEALRQFVETPGRHVTFTTGNHDIELCFAEVRQRILEAINPSNPQSIFFCLDRFYRPLPDVYIEHGNHYDFWNHKMHELWDEEGHMLTANPQKITLPIGSYYMQHAAHPVSLAYPYFDHFEPSINTMRQIALLSLLNPDIVVQVAHSTMEMISEPRPALANLAPGEERIPAKLFENAVLDFAAFQMDMSARKTDWQEPGREPGNTEEEEPGQSMASSVMEFMTLQEMLKLPVVEAVSAICTPATYAMGESVAKGMYQVLQQDQTLRYAIAGHTHMVRIDLISNGTQSYINTASWTTRLALPAPGEVTPGLVEWLRKPDWTTIPLRDVTQLTFAMITTTDDGKSSASLCAWEGGSKGSYRVLA